MIPAVRAGVVAATVLLSLAGATRARGQEPVVRDGFVEMRDGVRIHWRSMGERGDTVVFLHGGPGGRVDGRLPDLLELARSHVVLGYDQRGGGESVADSLTIGVDAHIEDLEQLRAHFGLERLTLFGHSWGGALAVLYAARYPEHVERLILNGPMPPARVPFDAERSAAIEQRKRELCGEMLGSVTDTAAFGACVRRPDMNARVYFADTTHIARVQGRGGGVDPIALRAGMRSLGDWDFRPAMAAVRAPTLVIEGTRSPVPLEQVRVWAQHIPAGRLLLIDGAGHGYALIERPDVFFPAIRRFLNGVWPDDAERLVGPGEDPTAFELMLAPATLGSAAGLALGALAGLQTGWGGGDDPGVLGAFVFGLAGSALGTAAGVEIGSSSRARFGTALASSTAGILSGAAVAWAAGHLFDDSGAAAYIGYAVGQGAFASLMTALIEND